MSGPSIPAVVQRPQVTEDGWGREELRRWLIGRYRVLTGLAGEPLWELAPGVEQDAIERCRFEYDEGAVELMQGRDGMWILQYRVPRRHPAEYRGRWFTREEGARDGGVRLPKLVARSARRSRAAAEEVFSK